MTREQFISYAELCRKPLRRFLTALCLGDTAAADDLAQESLIKAYLSCDKLNDEVKFQAWVFRIASNSFLSSKRSQRHFADIAEASALSSSERADDAFRYQALYAALDAIPPKERTALMLFYLQDYAVKDIAEAIGASQEAVRQYLSRGRRHLREKMQLNPE